MDENKKAQPNSSGQDNDAQVVLETRVAELEEKLKDTESKWKRALADYTNFEKRTVEEKKQIVSWANEDLIYKLLGILDNLEMVETHIQDAGLTMIVKNFKQVLEKEGLTETDATDKNFDPLEMDAIDLVAGEKNKVMQVLAKGYVLKDKLIRPAKVKVGNGQEAKEK